VKKLVLAAVLLAIPVMAADDNKPLPQESQVKLLKAERELQQLTMQMADLQTRARQLQISMEAECVAAAKTANVDLAKFNCDVDNLTFVPKPDKKEPAKKEPAKP
jgi:hypothetical protein